jgi:hypothetical protein
MEENPYESPKIPSEPQATKSCRWQFIERSFVDGEEVVVLRYLALYHWLRFPLLAAIVWASVTLRGETAFMVFAIAFVALLVAGIPYWPIGYEVKRRMKHQPVSLQGSRYSFSNPITYRWTPDSRLMH